MLPFACPARAVVPQPVQHAEKCNAQRLVILGGEEWARGNVSVRDLASRQQAEMAADQLA